MKFLYCLILSVFLFSNCATKNVNYSSNCKNGWSECHLEGKYIVVDSVATLDWLESGCKEIKQGEYLTYFKDSKGSNTWGSSLTIFYYNSNNMQYRYTGCTKSESKLRTKILVFLEKSIKKNGIK